MTAPMPTGHRCDWTFWPSSMDATWTCPECGTAWFASDGSKWCEPGCAEHGSHIGWKTIRFPNGNTDLNEESKP